MAKSTASLSDHLKDRWTLGTQVMKEGKVLRVQEGRVGTLRGGRLHTRQAPGSTRCSRRERAEWPSVSVTSSSLALPRVPVLHAPPTAQPHSPRFTPPRCVPRLPPKAHGSHLLGKRPPDSNKSQEDRSGRRIFLDVLELNETQSPQRSHWPSRWDIPSLRALSCTRWGR